MIKSKYIGVLALVMAGIALVIAIALPILANYQATLPVMKTEAEYESALFGTDIISIEIIADETQWQTMLDNAIQEEYSKVDVIVNGTKFSNVGIRPKGNSSLTQVAQSDSDRFSFRLQFDKYIEGQTCFGLESFVVNNILGDSTYMKEYVSYDIMKTIGVETPCFQYADISLNGENIGFYLAVELYNDSYEERVSGDTSGMLYNVKSMEMGGDKQEMNQGKAGIEKLQTPPENMELPDNMEVSENMELPDNGTASGNEAIPQRGERPSMPEGENGEKGFGRGGGSSGGSLQYTDDEVDSYSAIFGNVVGKGTTSDYQKVIKALKALEEGTKLEEYWNVDEILRYLAAHTVVVNLDSYSSNMAQNYYLYEKDGMVSVLPWDYNLAWGGFQNEDASSTINFPIDTPVSGVELSDRPLIAKLLEQEEYLERYHSYLQEILDTYFLNGAWESKVSELNTLIADYVKKDRTAFFTYEEYETGVSTFATLGNLRAQSILGQLTGEIPSTTEGQKANPERLISGESVSMDTLGTMNNRNHKEEERSQENKQENTKESG